MRSWHILLTLAGLLPLANVQAQVNETGVTIQGNALRYGLSLAQNESKMLSASYFNSDRKLYYLHWVNNGWAEELVHNTGIVQSYFNFTSLVYVYDQPHIVFYDSGLLRHSWRDYAGSWQTEIVDNGPSVGAYLSAIYCGAGKICVAYYDAANTDLKFAKGSAGSWTVSAVDSGANDLGQFTGIALNTSGRVLISYYDATLMLPKVAEQNQDETWSKETLPNIAAYGRWTSIIQGSDGTTHLAAGSWFDLYNNTEDGFLYYASKPAGGAWSAEQLPFTYTGPWTSIMLSSDNKPEICARRYMNSIFGQDSNAYYIYLDQNDNWQSVYLTPNVTLNYYQQIKCLKDKWDNPMVGYYFTTGAAQASGIELHAPTDSDGDLIPDAEDMHPNDSDADGDGLGDGYELLATGTDPELDDSDADSINDFLDVQPLEADNLNLVPDGNCEQGVVTAWSPLNAPENYSKESVLVAQGQRSLLLDSPGSFSGIVQRDLDGAQATRYLLQMYYQRLSGTARFTLGWGNDSDLEGAAFSDNSSSEWQSYSRYVTSPGAAGDLRLLIETDGGLVVDGIQLYESPPGATPIPQPTLRPTATPTSTPTQTRTPTPTATGSPTSTPTATPTTTSTPATQATATPGPATLISARSRAAKSSSKRSVVGKIYLDNPLQTPLQGRLLSIVCNSRLGSIKTSNSAGKASFLVARARKAKRCYLQSAEIKSNTVKVPARRP